MESLVQKFGPLTVRLTSTPKSTLCLIFPRAGANYPSHTPLIKSLTKLFPSVGFIESGYWGITDNGHVPLTQPEFTHQISKFLSSFPKLKKVYVVSESVGCVHALNLDVQRPGLLSGVILSNPAYYQPVVPHFFTRLLFRFSLAHPEFFLTLYSKLFKFIPTSPTRRLSTSFKNMCANPGSYSYLTCLREIMEYGIALDKEKLKKFLRKSVLIAGKKDAVFFHFCHTDTCVNNSLKTILLPAGHSLVDKHPREVINAFHQLFHLAL